MEKYPRATHLAIEGHTDCGLDYFLLMTHIREVGLFLRGYFMDPALVGNY